MDTTAHVAIELAASCWEVERRSLTSNEHVMRVKRRTIDEGQTSLWVGAWGVIPFAMVTLCTLRHVTVIGELRY